MDTNIAGALIVIGIIGFFAFIAWLASKER